MRKINLKRVHTCSVHCVIPPWVTPRDNYDPATNKCDRDGQVEDMFPFIHTYLNSYETLCMHEPNEVVIVGDTKVRFYYPLDGTYSFDLKANSEGNITRKMITDFICDTYFHVYTQEAGAFSKPDSTTRPENTPYGIWTEDWPPYLWKFDLSELYIEEIYYFARYNEVVLGIGS